MTKHKDIGLKIATKREALWITVRDNLRDRIKAYEDELEVAKMQLLQAEGIIEIEKNPNLATGKKNAL